MHAPLGKKLNCTVVSPSSGRTYTIRTDDKSVLSCSCPAWLNRRAAVGERTCKHIQQALREAGFVPAAELRACADCGKPEAEHSHMKRGGKGCSSSRSGGTGLPSRCPPHTVNEAGVCVVCKAKIFEPTKQKPKWMEGF